MKCLAPIISFVQNKTSIAIFRPFFNRNMVRPIICAAALLGTSLAVANGFDIASGSCCQPNLEKSLLCGPICGPMTPRNSNACTSLAATLPERIGRNRNRRRNGLTSAAGNLPLSRPPIEFAGPFRSRSSNSPTAVHFKNTEHEEKDFILLDQGLVKPLGNRQQESTDKESRIVLKMDLPIHHMDKFQSLRHHISAELAIGRLAMILAVVFLSVEVTTGMSLAEQLMSVFGALA